MKVFIILILLGLGVALHAVETFPQKIMFSVDEKRENSSYTKMIYETLLSKAASINGIVLLDQYAEKANVHIRIEVEKKGTNYNVGLYSVREENKTLLDSSLSFTENRFISGLEKMVSDIVQILKDRYPPKPKEEILQTEVVNEKISEFEKVEPTWALSVCLLSMLLNQYSIDFGTPSSSGGINYNGASERFFDWGVLAETTYTHRKWTFKAGAIVAPLMMRDFTFYVKGSYGIFGSLFLLGLTLEYNAGSIFATNAVHFSSEGFQIKMPDVSYHSLSIGLNMQYNITRDYYIAYDSGYSFGITDYRLMMDNGTTYTNIVPASGFYFGFSFNFKLFPKNTLFIRFHGNGVSTSESTNTIGVYNSRGLILKRFNINKTYFGVGYSYEF